METREFGISVVSFFPWSLGFGGAVRASRMANDSGIKKLQLLPLRGYDTNSVNRLPARGVISWEGPWNYGSFWKAFRRALGCAGEDYPTPLDWVVFGKNPMDPQIFGRLFPNALHVSHDSREKLSIYEVHPEGGLPSNKMSALCWDTWHVRRPYRNGNPSPFQWQRLLEEWKNQIALIHVHPTGSEVESLLTRRVQGELQYMLRLLAKASPNAPIVLEVAPSLGTSSQVVKRMSSLRQSVAEIMG